MADPSTLFPPERRILWLPVLLGVGIGLYFSLPEEPSLYLVPALGWLVALLWWRAPRKARFLVLILLFVGTGFAAAQLRSWYLDAPALYKPTRTSEISGTIGDIVHLESGYRLVLENPKIEGIPVQLKKLQAKFRGGEEGLALGQQVRLKGRLFPPPLPSLPGGYDFARNDYFKQVGAVGFAFGKPDVISPAPAEASWREYINGLRENLTQRIVSAMDTPYGGIAAAMMTGARDHTPEVVTESFRAAGISHLLAISGLHMGLVAALVFLIIRRVLAFIPRIALYHDTKKWAAAAAIIGGFAYLLISGAPVPAQRSYIMAVCFLLAILVDRTHMPMRIIAFAAALILLIFPETMLGASFQLSFAATVAILALYEDYMRRHSGEHFVPVEHTLWRRFWSYLLGIAATSLAATIATTPYSIYHFHTFSFYGLAANMLAIPLTSFWIMPWAVVAFLLMPFGAEGLALAPMQWGIAALVDVADYIRSLPASIIFVPPIATWGIVLVTLGGLWLCLWRTRIRWAGLIPIVIGFSSMLFQNPPDMLISEKHIALIHGKKHIALLNSRRASFTEKNWLEELGLESFTPREKIPDLFCDDRACDLMAGGQRVRVLLPPALPQLEDCEDADILIVRGRKIPEKMPCLDKTLFIRDFALWRQGTHVLRFTGKGMPEVISVADVQGMRKWSRKR